MQARAAREGDEGFTLIELLVVMIIIGILAAIAIPSFLSQRGVAQDTAVKSDASVLGKEIATHFVDGTAAPTVTISGGQYLVAGAATGSVSTGVAFQGGSATAADTTGWTDGAWCFGLTNPAGRYKDFKYSAQAGLQRGTCSSTTAP